MPVVDRIGSMTWWFASFVEESGVAVDVSFQAWTEALARELALVLCESAYGSRHNWVMTIFCEVPSE